MLSVEMAIIKLEQLSSIRKKHKEKKIVFCAGSFDLTHAGHILFFEDCKKYGDVLVAMVGNDSNLRNYKGKERPILNQYVRLKTVSSFKPVDYALLDLDAPNNDFLAILTHVFKELKPDFYVVNTDAFDMPKRHELVKGTQTQLVILDRTCPPEFENISTSKIIERIKTGENKKDVNRGIPHSRP